MNNNNGMNSCKYFGSKPRAFIKTNHPEGWEELINRFKVIIDGGIDPSSGMIVINFVAVGRTEFKNEEEKTTAQPNEQSSNKPSEKEETEEMDCFRIGDMVCDSKERVIFEIGFLVSNVIKVRKEDIHRLHDILYF